MPRDAIRKVPGSVFVVAADDQRAMMDIYVVEVLHPHRLDAAAPLAGRLQAPGVGFSAVGQAWAEQAPLPVWLVSLASLPAPAAALELQRRINRELVAGHFDDFAAAFAALDPGCLSTLVLVGCLRATYAARTHIDGWQRFAERIATELGDRDMSSAVLLRGLLG